MYFRFTEVSNYFYASVYIRGDVKKIFTYVRIFLALIYLWDLDALLFWRSKLVFKALESLVTRKFFVCLQIGESPDRNC